MELVPKASFNFQFEKTDQQFIGGITFLWNSKLLTLWNNYTQLEVYFVLAVSVAVPVTIVSVTIMIRNEGFRWTVLF